MIMDTQLLNEVIACLPKGKTHFRYFKGAFASRLLSILLPRQSDIKDIKQTRFASLLAHPSVKPVLATCGDGKLKRRDLSNVWQEPALPFLLTVSRWGATNDRSWHQTSRFGENLVLQLNLPFEHQRLYKHYIDKTGGTLNGYSGHPVQQPNAKNFRETLAWSRIDFDFHTNEALIEEVQSDAVRDVIFHSHYHCKYGCEECQKRMQYARWFNGYKKIWAEAMLCATIEFIHFELGIERIFMHTARSGWQVKLMDQTWHAPRSLYSDLPKKFCFKQTWAAPEFLLEARCYQRLIRRQPDIDFYQLSLNEMKNNFLRGEILCHA